MKEAGRQPASFYLNHPRTENISGENRDKRPDKSLHHSKGIHENKYNEKKHSVRLDLTDHSRLPLRQDADQDPSPIQGRNRNQIEHHQENIDVDGILKHIKDRNKEGGEEPP